MKPVHARSVPAVAAVVAIAAVGAVAAAVVVGAVVIVAAANQQQFFILSHSPRSGRWPDHSALKSPADFNIRR